MSTAPDDRLAEPILVTLDAVAAFASLGIRYAVGGSLASSFHGKPRSTDDVDLVAEIAPAHVQALVAAWSPSYYADGEMIRDAVRRRASFNIIREPFAQRRRLACSSRSSCARRSAARARPASHPAR